MRTEALAGLDRAIGHVEALAAVLREVRAQVETEQEDGALVLRVPPGKLRDVLAEVTAQAILAALAAEGGSKSRAAKRLGIARRSLLNWEKREKRRAQ